MLMPNDQVAPICDALNTDMAKCFARKQEDMLLIEMTPKPTFDTKRREREMGKSKATAIVKAACSSFRYIYQTLRSTERSYCSCLVISRAQTRAASNRISSRNSRNSDFNSGKSHKTSQARRVKAAFCFSGIISSFPPSAGFKLFSFTYLVLEVNIGEAA